MDVPFVDAVNHLFPLDLWQVIPQAAGNLRWTPLFRSKVSEDDRSNYFLVDVTVENPQGASIGLMFGVHGRDTVESVCSIVFAKLREYQRLGPDSVSAVFRTVQENPPLIIPSGALMADLLKTNCAQNGVSVPLSVTIVEHTDGALVISPEGEDLMMGSWMHRLMSQ